MILNEDYLEKIIRVPGFQRLSQKCPCCHQNLFVMLKYKKGGQPFYQIECPKNWRHIRCFANYGPWLWEKGLDFSDWKFDEQNVLCPVCKCDLDGGPTATKAGRPCITFRCEDNYVHFTGFLDLPDKLRWQILIPKESVVEEAESEGVGENGDRIE